ncbi:hypothetical protein JOC85_002721 [Bacillus mesophilus]|uniref:Putative metal-dependent hydrolase n=1 Tax=Bacillus mesophilus TaxID=1808955 RepID=A0A6M0Q8N0_9BACI|nr:putative metal-dependent hydrolase [Bacillus mesophilus]MBM7661914.1 hypothetical protein [Bacillus mesophilus]NEY72726.1 putative metal-dependent hydrolase [Bacillus mesophilus]
MEQLQYPIGKFKLQDEIYENTIITAIKAITELPNELKKMVIHLSEHELSLSYREGGWNVRQLIHHIADSHMNSFIRFKLALTEEDPTIKPYDEKSWAELSDTQGGISSSLSIIEGVHERWGNLLSSLEQEDFNKAFIHPEIGRISLSTALFLYEWHGKHHLAHIDLAVNKK